MGGYNGSGTYTRYYNWTNDANAGIKIRSDRMDTEDNGFASGLSNVICKDGQTTVTANIPFNGFKLTNIGDAALAKDAVNVETLQNGQLIYGGITTGSNTYAFNTTPSLTAYMSGQTFRLVIGNTNSGASTLNYNGLGAKNILKRTASGTLTALANSDLISGYEYDFFYDGTQFQVSGSQLDPSIATTYAPINSPTFTGTVTTPTIVNNGLTDISGASSGQIKFPATQNASANANTLDDYEEGTWTPALSYVTPGDLNIVYSARVGTYTKIGDTVVLHCTLVTSTYTHTTSSGTEFISGTPFAPITTTNYQAYGAMSVQGLTMASYTNFAVQLNASNSNVLTIASAQGQPSSATGATQAPTGTQQTRSFSITYKTAT